MGAFSELDIERRNGSELHRIVGDEADLATLAERLGGEVEGRFVRCPSPGYSADDRSCHVRFDGVDRIFP